MIDIELTDTDLDNWLPPITEKAPDSEQPEYSMILARTIRTERRIQARLQAMQASIDNMKGHQMALRRRIEEADIDGKAKSLFVSKAARNKGYFVLASGCVLSFILGTLIGGL